MADAAVHGTGHEDDQLVLLVRETGGELAVVDLDLFVGEDLEFARGGDADCGAGSHFNAQGSKTQVIDPGIDLVSAWYLRTLGPLDLSGGSNVSQSRKNDRHWRRGAVAGPEMADAGKDANARGHTGGGNHQISA